VEGRDEATRFPMLALALGFLAARWWGSQFFEAYVVVVEVVYLLFQGFLMWWFLKMYGGKRIFVHVVHLKEGDSEVEVAVEVWVGGGGLEAPWMVGLCVTTPFLEWWVLIYAISRNS